MKKNVKTQLMITGLAAGLVLVAYTTSFNSGDGDFLPPPAPKKVYPQVTTIQPKLSDFTSNITGYGAVTPVQNLNLAAEVSGRVIELSPAFLSGKRVNAGDMLLKIDDARYREVVASAESALASARVTLLQQQLNQTQAKTEWRRSGLSGSPDSELALYEPQVKAAQAAVEHARRTLVKARSDLEKTVIRAPFNALVISRSTELGGYTQSGTELAVLYGTDQVEITLPIATKDWRNLPQNPEDNNVWQVTLSDTESEHQWQGYVHRMAQHIESNTRQRALIVRLDNPLDQSPPLFPGTFITASIPGKTIENVWQLPASTVTQNNEVWFVDNNNTLTKVPAKIRLRMNDKTYLEPEKSFAVPQVVALPLASYLPGMKVNPITKVTEQQVPTETANTQVATQ